MTRLALICALVSLTGPARAGALAETRAGAAVRWSRDTLALEVVAPPARAGVAAAELLAAARDAARSWNDALAACEAPRLRVDAGPPGGAVAQDGRNVIHLTAGRWCPPDAADEGECYEPRRGAITHLFPATSEAPEGDVAEADVEINAVSYAWSGDGRRAGTRSLRLILGHELGHVLGLAHSCAGDASGPACRAPAARASIMYPFPLDEGWPPVLDPDERSVRALCDAYGRRRGPLAGFVVGSSALACLAGVAGARRARRKRR